MKEIISYYEQEMRKYITDEETLEAMQEQFIEYCEENKRFVDMFIRENKEYLEELKEEN